MRHIILITVSILILISGCKKNEPIEHSVLRKLHKQYPKQGISQCFYKGNKVYCLGQLYFDGGNTVFNEQGTKILTCNYAWGPIDSGCYQLENCEQIYCPTGNSLNLPPIDKYGLDNY